MLFHPIINQLANIDLTLLRGVTPAHDQLIEGQTACFCPFCKQRDGNNSLSTGEGGGRGCSPHFIIYNDTRGGLYNGTGVDNRQAEAGALRWMCTKSKRSGYGAIELYAAIHNLTLHGYGLLKTCHDLVCEVYGDNEQVRQRYPMLFGKLDYRTVSPNTIDTFSFMPKTDFNAYELQSLGCEVHIRKGIYHFSFGGTWTPGQQESPEQKALRRSQGIFWPSDLCDDFRIYPVESVTLPATVRNGSAVSEVLVGTPWNPLFVCFATDNISPLGSCGCFFRPAMQQNNIIVFSTAEEHTVSKVSKWLMGDKVFNYYLDRHTPHAAMTKFDPTETFTTTKEIWEESVNQKGNPIVNKVEVELEKSEIRARQVVFCQSPQDAIATYYTHRSLRLEKLNYAQRQAERINPAERTQSPLSSDTSLDRSYPLSSDASLDHKAPSAQPPLAESANEKGNKHPSLGEGLGGLHVAFLLGRSQFHYIDHGEWHQSQVEFSSPQNRKLTSFAEKVICLFPNDMRSQRSACNIARRFRDIHLALLPDTFRMVAHQRMQWIYGAKVHTVRDFILSYVMFDEEAFLYDRDARKLFASILTTAKPADPIERKEKRNVNNILKEVYYVVNAANVWTYLMCEGYFRSVNADSTDKVGQYIHLDGPFVTPITKESMVMFAQQRIEEYAARLVATQPSLADEYPLMLQGIAHSKDINEKSISRLPAIELDYKSAYSSDVDHFFYKNGALRITKSDITLIPYSEVQFNIDPRAVLDWNFTRPRKEPFAISENPEYAERRARIDRMRTERDADGNLVYTLHQIGKEESDLEVWSRVNRWRIDWFNQTERDLWNVLRVIRGFANISWQMEEERIRTKTAPTDYDRALLDSHMANFLFALGRMLYLYHGDATVSAPYLMENAVKDQKRATGGSGKSTLVNIFAACSGKVLGIDCKSIQNGTDLRFILQEYIPNVHRIVHWEDWSKGFSMKFLYNYVTKGMKSEQKHEKSESSALDESPNHVVSSNYPMSDSDDSTVGRFPMIPFSDRFARANPMLNKPARKINDVMPDFSSIGPEYLSSPSRNQMAYVNALAVQFLMRYKEIVNAPLDDVKQRQLIAELSEPMVRYMQYFFAQQAVFGEPQDLKSMFREFVRDFTDSSDAKKDGYALRTFKEKTQQWCDFNGITMNPPHLLETKADLKTGYFHLKAWVTKEYFADNRWTKDPDRHPVFIRELDRTDNACLFYRQEDTVPADYKDFKDSQYRDFLNRPDPLPVTDEMGNVITITEQDKAQSVAGPSRTPPPPVPCNALQGSSPLEDELPF